MYHTSDPNIHQHASAAFAYRRIETNSIIMVIKGHIMVTLSVTPVSYAASIIEYSVTSETRATETSEIYYVQTRHLTMFLF
jgi:hypothetical protein